MRMRGLFWLDYIKESCVMKTLELCYFSCANGDWAAVPFDMYLLAFMKSTCAYLAMLTLY